MFLSWAQEVRVYVCVCVVCSVCVVPMCVVCGVYV